MADFLDICGVQVKCAQLTMKPEPIGAGITRSANATAHSNEQAHKWHGKGATVPIPLTDALFLTALLARRHDHWTFDADTYSDRGRAATTAGTAPTIVVISPTPKRGAGCLKIVSGTGNTIQWTVNSIALGYTILVWVSQNAGAWQRYVLTADPSHLTTPGAWINGVYQGNIGVPWLLVDTTNNILKLVGVAGGSPANDYAFDDLVLIPAPFYNSPNYNTLGPALDAFLNAQAWPTPAPQVYVSGDFHPVALTMLGDAGDAENLQGNLFDGAGRKSNLRKLQFELSEV